MARNITVKDLTTAMKIQKERDDQRIAADAPTWPMEKWPYPTPGQGPLPNKELPKLSSASGYAAPPDYSMMPTDPNDPMSFPKMVVFKKIQRALKDLSPKEYERRKQNGTLPHFGMDMEDLEYYLEDLEAGKAPDRGHPDTHDYLVGPQEELMIGNTGGITNKEYNRPRGGPGGTDSFPFDDFGNDRNPAIINPSTGRREWAISHGIHKSPDGWSQPTGTHPGSEHKMPGNSGEYYYNDMQGGDLEEWNPQIHNPLISDHRRGSEILNTLPRGGYYGNSHRDQGIDPRKLIETLKIAAPEFLKA